MYFSCILPPLTAELSIEMQQTSEKCYPNLTKLSTNFYLLNFYIWRLIGNQATSTSNERSPVCSTEERRLFVFALSNSHNPMVFKEEFEMVKLLLMLHNCCFENVKRAAWSPGISLIRSLSEPKAFWRQNIYIFFFTFSRFKNQHFLCSGFLLMW